MKYILISILFISGFIISCQKDFSPIELSDEIDVDFTQSTFLKSEPVQFLIQNNSKQTIHFQANTCQGIIGFEIEKKINSAWFHNCNHKLDYSPDSSGVFRICDREPLILRPGDKYLVNELLSLQPGEYRLILKYYFGEFQKPNQERRSIYSDSFLVR